MKKHTLTKSHRISGSILRAISSAISSATFKVMLGLLAVQSVNAAETTPDSETSNPATSVTIDHSESDRISNQSNEQETTENSMEYADEAPVNRGIEYDHCHFEESHQHHHCYDAGEHEHNVVEADQVYISESRVYPNRRYTHYTTRRPSTRYYSTHGHYNSHERHHSQNRQDNWNSIALGLAIGLPLAYSNHNYNRGGYRSNGYGYNRNGYGRNGYNRQGYNRNGYNHRGNRGRNNHGNRGRNNRGGRH